MKAKLRSESFILSRSSDKYLMKAKLMTINLKNHCIWNDLEKLTIQIDPVSLAKERLNNNNGFKIFNYCHFQEELYQEIFFPYPLLADLKGSLFCIDYEDNCLKKKFKFYFLLKVNLSIYNGNCLEEFDKEVAEMTLWFNPNLELIDENWVVYISSPFVVAKKHSSK